jgi:hypothetical protein
VIDSELMNKFLDRLGIEARAVPGELAFPVVIMALSRLLDRIEALERERDCHTSRH